MKRILLSILFIIYMTTMSDAQTNSYGLTFGVGSGSILKQTLEGGPSHDIHTGFSIGLNYNRKLTNKLGLMSGLNWYSNNVTVTPQFYPGNDRTPKDYNVQLIYGPLLLKVDLGKYFFINSGVIGDIDITNKKSSLINQVLEHHLELERNIYSMTSY